MFISGFGEAWFQLRFNKPSMNSCTLTANLKSLSMFTQELLAVLIVLLIFICLPIFLSAPSRGAANKKQVQQHASQHEREV